MDLHGLWGHSCLTMSCALGCRGIPAPAAGTPPAPPSPLTLVTAEMFFSHMFIFLFSGCNFSCAITVFPYSCNIIPEMPPPSLMGLALASSRSLWSHLRLALSNLWRKLLANSYTAQPCALPNTPKPCHSNPIHRVI